MSSHVVGSHSVEFACSHFRNPSQSRCYGGNSLGCIFEALFRAPSSVESRVFIEVMFPTVALRDYMKVMGHLLGSIGEGYTFLHTLKSL